MGNVKTQSVKVSKTNNRAANRAANKAVRKTAQLQAQERYSFKDATYLKEGVTGKDRRAALLSANKKITHERASYHAAIRDIFAVGSEFIDQVNMSKTQFKKETTPRMIKDRMTTYNLYLAINSLTDEKRGYINYTPYMVMNCIERALKNEAPNKLAVKFFDALEAMDLEATKKAISAIRTQYNKEKKAREDKKKAKQEAQA